MNDMWLNFTLEIALFSFLGILYYFYQKRKILRYEENKTPLVMNFLLQTCLSEKLETSQPQLDKVIEALDDYLKDTETKPPLALLKSFAHSSVCSPELKAAILQGFKELEQ